MLGRIATSVFYGGVVGGTGFVGSLFVFGPDAAIVGVVIGVPVGLYLGWRFHRRLSGWGDGLTGIDF